MVPQTLDHDWFPKPLPSNVKIGERSWLYSSFAFQHYRSERPCGVSIGSDSGLYAGTFFDLGPAGEVEIGNYCTLVGAIISTNGRMVIKNYAFIAHEVVIADFPAATPFPEGMVSQEIVIEENAWIGARAIILGGARIGKNAIVGAGTTVDFDVPNCAIVAGNPAKIRGSLRK